METLPAPSSSPPARWADWRTGIIACRATGSELIQINQLFFFFLSRGCGLAVVLGLSVRERVWIQLEELESGQSAGRSGPERLNSLRGKTRERESFYLPSRACTTSPGARWGFKPESLPSPCENIFGHRVSRSQDD